MHHVGLADTSCVLHRRHALVKTETLRHAGLQRRLGDEGERGRGARPAEGGEHRAVVHRLRRGDGGVRVAHGGRGDEPALEDQAWLDAEEGRAPEHQVGELAHLHRAHLVGDAVGDGGVDGVLGDVALGAHVVVVRRIARKRAALHLHLVRGLPGAGDDLAHAAHGLGVGGDHREGAEVVEDVLGGDGLAADARLGEGDVLGDARVQMVADHEHVEMLVHRVHRVGPGRVGGRGQHVGLAARADDVRCVAAAGPFGVIGVDGAALEGGEGVLHEARLVEGVGVDGHLHVEGLGHRQAVVDGRGRGAPVLVQLQPHRPGLDLLLQGRGQTGVALAEKAQVHGKFLGSLEHALDVPGARGAGGGVGAGGRPGAAAQHGGDAGHQRLLHLLRADEVDMGVDAAGGEDAALAGDGLGAGTDDDVHARLHVGVAGLADAGDAPVLDADVGLDDAPVIEDQGVGDDRVHHLGAGALALAHAVADHLAAAELHLLAVDRAVVLDLDPQLGVAEAHPVAHRGPVHLRVGLSRDPGHQSSPPITSP